VDTSHGDEVVTALILVPDQLISAVHQLDAAGVTAAFETAGQLALDELAGARHLAVVAAGMCSEDHTPPASLGWTLDPSAYRQFRSRADALTASLRAGRTAQMRSAT
jgi:hypothetical protein